MELGPRRDDSRFRLTAHPLVAMLAMAWALGSLAVGAVETATTQVRQLQLEPCAPTLSDRVPHHFEARCGSLEVWEDQDAKAGRRIPLRVVVVSGFWSTGTENPIFELVGGPGAAATEIGDLISVSELFRDRDLVLVDARGTGGSNPLDCEPTGPADRLQTYLDQVFPTGPMDQCRDALSKKADLALYNTRNLVQDLDEVRRALGHEKIILYGTSYGTRVALEYLRSHSEHVDFAVLNGVVPPGVYSPRHFARNAQTALDALVEACEDDTGCHRAFPDFRSELGSLLSRIRERPVTVEVENQLLGETERVTISYPVFAASFRYVLYSSRGSSRIPWLVRQAAAGDLAPLMSVIAEIATETGRYLYFGQYASFDCAEGPPFIDVDAEHREGAGTWFGDIRLRTQLEICAVWPRGRAPEGFHEPVVVDVPVLLISGEVDPVTPPSMGEEVAASLPNSRHLILEGASHSSMEALVYCAVPIMHALSQRRSFDGVDLSCHGRRFERPPFFLGTERASPTT